jgi:DNA-binding NtrC family response regulator
MKLLVISSNPEFISQSKTSPAPIEAEVFVASGAQQGLKILKEVTVDSVIVDSRLKDLQVAKLIRKILEKSPLCDIIVAVENLSNYTYDEILSYGADEIVEIPLNAEELAFKVKNLWQTKQNLKACGLVGKSQELKSIAEQVLQIAPTDITVLITGESGTGKELIAKAIHNISPREDKPFLAVNCAAFAEGVLESELFGHERGAFTGAIARKKGVFEAAGGGTIFLDEVGELKPATQVRLLRVLEEREIMRVGGTERIQVDARVITATNRDLIQAVEEGHFRRDLYYRIAVVKIEMPPLRSRPKDIPILVYDFLNRLKDRQPERTMGISDSAMEAILRYHWPGNVRELKNFVESSAALSRTARIDAAEALTYIEKQSQVNRNLPVVTGKTAAAAEHELIFQALTGLRAEIFSLKQMIQQGIEMTQRDAGRYAEAEPVSEEKLTQESLDQLEKEHVRRVLAQVGGNRRKASQILGIGERTLYRKLKEYGFK